MSNAVYYGQIDFVKLLLEYNCDLSIKDEENKTAMDRAKDRDFQFITQLLHQNRNEYSLLHSASEHGDLNLVKKLLQYVADVNCRDPEKQTPLHYASLKGKADIVKFLIENGAEINCQTDH